MNNVTVYAHERDLVEPTTDSGELRIRNSIVPLSLDWPILPILLRCQKPWVIMCQFMIIHMHEIGRDRTNDRKQ